MEKMITYQIKGLVKEYPGFTLKIDDLTLYRGKSSACWAQAGQGKPPSCASSIFWRSPRQEKCITAA